MAKTVVMPQMGESVAEGTIVRWLKKVGDAVERDEPLFEISTDKVDAEIPSPAAGVVSEVKVKEGETVAINTVVAVIDDTASKPASAAPPPAGKPAAAAKPVEAPAAVPPAKTAQEPTAQAAHPVSAPQGDGDTGRNGPYAPFDASASASPSPTSSRKPVAPVTPRTTPAASVAPGLATPWSAADARNLRLSPVVRKIARERQVDVRNIAGSGEGGRVTKNDILAYLDAGAPASAAEAASARQAPAPPAPLLGPNPSATAGLAEGKYERTPMSVMRRKIAEHMVMSKRTSPHVHSAFEIDFTKVDEIRKAKKDQRIQARPGED